MTRHLAGVLLGLTLLVAACDSAPVGLKDGRTPVGWRVEGDAWLRPAVDDSVVYFVGRERELVALDKRTGRVRWRTLEGRTGSMTIGNLLLVGGLVVMPDGELYAFDRRTGLRRYRVRTTDGYAPGHGIIATDDTLVFVGVPFGRAYAFDASSGEQRWRAIVGPENAGVSGPAVGRDIVVVGTWNVASPSTGALIALDKRTGTERWRRVLDPDPAQNGETAFSAGAVVVGDIVVAAMDDGRVYGLEAATGDLRWTVPRVEWRGPDARRLTVSGTTVYAASQSGIIVGIDAATGTVLSTAITGWGSIEDPVAVNDRFVYALHLGGQITATDRLTGALRWQRGELGEFTAPPAADNERVYSGGRTWLSAFPP